MEYWSNEKNQKHQIFIFTPILQHSTTPALHKSNRMEIKNRMELLKFS